MVWLIDAGESEFGKVELNGRAVLLCGGGCERVKLCQELLG